MVQKNQNSRGIKDDEVIFNEEVKEDELYSKKDVDDHIYIRKFFGGPLLITLGVILVLISLFSLLYGLLNADSDLNGRQIGVVHTKYKLLVTHSNNNYGGKIDSISEYVSSSDAYTYDFKVSNNRNVLLNYNVELVSTNFIPDVSYQLVKNGEVVSENQINTSGKIKLYNTSINANTTDVYKIKIWSNTQDRTDSYEFKINVEG